MWNHSVRVLTLALFGGSLALTQAQAPVKAKNWTVPKTAWGHPDLQGIWTSDDLHDVPMERPAQFGTRRFLTEEEYKKRADTLQKDRETIETGERNGAFWTRQQGVDAAAVQPHWVEFARKASMLSSLVSTPDNGRIPALTERAKKLRAEQPAYFNMRPGSYMDATMYDRCISRGVTGSFFPSIYGNGSQFIQTPDMVAIRYEMIHETRLIPLDNRPRASAANTKLRSYMGEPRGHWEGETLVVETTNFTGDKLAVGGTPYSENLKLTERFTRTGDSVIEYEATINDPETFTTPWKVSFPITREPGYQIFEYACHEGNYSMRNRLSAARAEEAKEATGK
jgi:hypothetical protein